MKNRTALFLTLTVAALAWTISSIAAQSSGKGDAESHLKAYDAHTKLAQSSPYKAMSWSWIGPPNVGGRMTDIA